MTIRLFEVNNSAPPTMARTSARENARPPRSAAKPCGASLAPTVAAIANSAPKALKAPARTDSVMRERKGMRAFSAPLYSAFRAIWSGRRASIPAGRCCMLVGSSVPVSRRRSEGGWYNTILAVDFAHVYFKALSKRRPCHLLVNEPLTGLTTIGRLSMPYQTRNANHALALSITTAIAAMIPPMIHLDRN